MEEFTNMSVENPSFSNINDDIIDDESIISNASNALDIPVAVQANICTDDITVAYAVDDGINLLPPELRDFSFNMKHFVYIENELNPKYDELDTSEEAESQFLIVATHIIIRNLDGEVVYSIKLSTLNASQLRLVAKKFSCKNLGSSTKYKIRFAIAH